MLTPAQAWDHLHPDAPKCDACRREVYRGEFTKDNMRPYGFGSLAELGILNVLCFDCATPRKRDAEVIDYAPQHWTQQQLTNLVEACVARAIDPPKES